jgi:hypothetical protein
MLHRSLRSNTSAPVSSKITQVLNGMAWPKTPEIEDQTQIWQRKIYPATPRCMGVFGPLLPLCSHSLTLCYIKPYTFVLD